jgi:putative ABC transport system substrate-binding protein
MLNRRTLLKAVGVSLASVTCSALSQQSGRIPTVGLLMTTLGPDHPFLRILRTRLRELGYVEGQSIHYEFRSAYGQLDRLPRLATELAERRVDVIVAGPDVAVLAAKRSVRTIPIVMLMFTTDPVAAGIIDSFSKPGGNITGLYGRQSEMLAKRLQLLKETVPGLSRVGVLYDAFSDDKSLPEVNIAAHALKIEIVPIEVSEPSDFQAAFNSASDAKVGALMMLDSVNFFPNRERIARLALKHRLPTMAQFQQFTQAGGLMSYGSNNEVIFARAAYFVDRLLRGVKAEELPVEQIESFKLIVNLRTAKALGVTVSPSILLQADTVIR